MFTNILDKLFSLVHCNATKVAMNRSKSDRK